MFVLGLASVSAAPTAPAATRVTAQSVVWGAVDGTPVFLDDLDTASLPAIAAQVSGLLGEGNAAFEYYAGANLATGTLKVLSKVTTNPLGATVTAQSGSATPATFARIEETLTFTPSDDQPYAVGVTMDTQGTYAVDPSSSGRGNAQLSLSASGGPGDFDQHDFAPQSPFTPLSHQLHVVLDLQGEVTASLFAQLAGDLYGISGSNVGSVFDFANSAHLGLAVPAGVSVTSGSGVFLSAPVPLPSSLFLLAPALCALRRGRSRHRVAWHRGRRWQRSVAAVQRRSSSSTR